MFGYEPKRLTPDEIAAVKANAKYASWEDPGSHHRILLWARKVGDKVCL